MLKSADWVFINHVPNTVVKSQRKADILITDFTSLHFKTLLNLSLWVTSSFSHINEDKRKTEGQVQMFEILRDVDGCPVSIFGQKPVVSIQSSFETKSFRYKSFRYKVVSIRT